MEFTGFHRDREGPVGRPATSRKIRPDRRPAAGRRQGDRGQGQRREALPAAARQRRQGAARRGRHRQDHRRGGPLLAHRPVGLRRQRRGLQGGHRGAAPGARGARRRRWSRARHRVRQRGHRAGASTATATAGSCTTSCRRPSSRTLSDAINALAEPISKVAAVVAARSRESIDGGASSRRRGHHARRRRRGRGRRRGGRRGGAADRSTAESAERRRRPAAPCRSTATHQAGIVTPAQDRLHFVAFDVITKDRDRLVELLEDWTAAAARMTAGQRRRRDRRGQRHPRGAAGRHRRGARPAAVGADPHHRLRPDAVPRRRPAWTASASPTERPPALADLPQFPGDALQPAISGGDICVQACANDPQVAVHAIRNLARIGMGVVSVRWSQLGFGRTSSTSQDAGHRRATCSASRTARPTSRPRRPTCCASTCGCSRATDRTGWPAAPTWSPARSGCSSRPGTGPRSAEQEAIVGRTKGSGAPLGQTAEFDEPDFAAVGADGEPLIAEHRARAAGPPEPEQRRPAAAPGLQLRRRLRRPRAAQRRACSSSPTSATRARQFVPVQRSWPGTT